MFLYNEKESYLHKRNPAIKLLALFIISMVVTFSYHPAFPLILVLTCLLFFHFGGNIPWKVLMERLWVFVILSLLFIYSMLSLKGLEMKKEFDFALWIFTWKRTEIWYILALGLRILCLVTLSLGFVLTTKPRDFIFSLIHQCKLSDVQGYSVLAAYRFVPDMQRQADCLYFAQEMRGLLGKNGKNKLLAPFRILLPMLHTAVRRGERVACSMESRGLSRNNERTYIRRMKIVKEDIWFLVYIFIFHLLCITILYRLGMYKFALYMRV